jgi:hypothetical protein
MSGDINSGYLGAAARPLAGSLGPKPSSGLLTSLSSSFCLNPSAVERALLTKEAGHG